MPMTLLFGGYASAITGGGNGGGGKYPGFQEVGTDYAPVVSIGYGPGIQK